MSLRAFITLLSYRSYIPHSKIQSFISYRILTLSENNLSVLFFQKRVPEKRFKTTNGQKRWGNFTWPWIFTSHRWTLNGTLPVLAENLHVVLEKYILYFDMREISYFLYNFSDVYEIGNWFHKALFLQIMLFLCSSIALC